MFSLVHRVLQHTLVIIAIFNRLWSPSLISGILWNVHICLHFLTRLFATGKAHWSHPNGTHTHAYPRGGHHETVPSYPTVGHAWVKMGINAHSMLMTRRSCDAHQVMFLRFRDQHVARWRQSTYVHNPWVKWVTESLLEILKFEARSVPSKCVVADPVLPSFILTNSR